MFKWFKNQLPAETRMNFDPYIEVSSYSGHRREKAIRKLHKIQDPKAIPLLVERANDWVPEVRQAALEALEVFLHQKYASAWLQNIGQIVQLSKKTRADHSNLIEKIYAIFDDPLVSKIVNDALFSSEAAQRRFAFKVAFRNPHSSVLELISYIFQTNDVALRKEIEERLHSISDDLYFEIEELGIQDLFGRTRTLFLHESVCRKSSKSAQFVKNALFDRSSAVRSSAIPLADEYGINPLSIFSNIIERAHTSSENKYRIAVWGVAKLNHKKSISILRIKLKDETIAPATTLVLLGALYKLQAKDIQKLLFEFLNSSKLSVARYSAKLLIKARYKLSTSTLTMLLGKQNCENYATSVLLPLNDIRGKWDRLEFLLLMLLKAKSNMLFGNIKERLSKWNANYNRSQAQLSEVQRERLLNLIQSTKIHTNNKAFRTGHTIVGTLYEELEFTINSTK